MKYNFVNTALELLDKLVFNFLLELVKLLTTNKTIVLFLEK